MGFHTATPTRTLRVMDYVGKHARCEATQIAEALGINTNSVRTILGRARERGEVKRTASGGGRIVLWELGHDDTWEPKDEPALGSPHRSTVSTWEPHHQRDPLVSALFGRGA